MLPKISAAEAQSHPIMQSVKVSYPVVWHKLQLVKTRAINPGVICSNPDTFAADSMQYLKNFVEKTINFSFVKMFFISYSIFKISKFSAADKKGNS